jgi:hypothetical protein
VDRADGSAALTGTRARVTPRVAAMIPASSPAMNLSTRSRATLGAAGLLALLSACGGAAQGARSSTTEQAMQPRARAPEPAVDLSEVPMPDDVVAIVRTASINALVDRVGQLTGMNEIIRAQVDEGFANWRSPLANLVDRNGAVDLVVVHRGHNDTDVAFAFGGPSMDEVERALANSHRLVPMSNGARRLEATSDDAAHDGTQCIVSPSLRPAVTRIVCGEHLPVVEHIAPFVVRTLARREIAPNAVTLEMPMEAARRNLLADTVQTLERRRAEIDQTLATRSNLDPATREAVVPLAREAIDALRGLLEDPSLFGAALTFDADRITLHLQLDMRTPESTLLQAALTMLHPQGPVPPDMIAHLLPDGYAYFGGTVEQSGFQPTVRQVVTLGEQIIQHANQLDAGDRAALRAALDALPPLGRVSEAFGMGADADGRPWIAGSMRSSAMQPAQWIASARAMLAAVRRPHLQTQIRSLLGLANAQLPDLGALRELPTTGLPAGSLLVQLPPFSAFREAARAATASSAPPPGAARPRSTGNRGRATTAGASTATARTRRGAAEPPLQFLVVPSGQDSVLVIGTDARAIYTRYAANTTPGIDPQSINAPDAAIVTAMVLGGMPNLLRASSEREQREFAQALQNAPDHGHTPIVFRMGSQSVNQQAQLVFDVLVSAATVRDIVHMATRGMGGSGPNTGAPPAGPITP